MSLAFDPTDKKNKPIIDYFENKTWLVLESSSSVRASIKKSIAQLGSKISNMIDADNFVDAQHLIETKKPHFVIGNNTIKGGSTVSLFDSHLKVSSNRLQSGFFVIADEYSMSQVASTLEYEMDGIITLPFSALKVMDCLVNGVKNKISPTPYQLKLEEGRTHYLTGDLESATACFQSALALHTRPYESLYFLGIIYNDNNLVDNAIASFEESVRHNSDCFKTLNCLSNLYFQTKNYKKAYDVNYLMVQKFPISPEKIPDLIKLSIINKKYEDINNYLQLIQCVKAPDSQTQISLAAGLAILGKYFLSQNDIDQAVEALTTSFKFSNGKYEILKNITYSFTECQKIDVLQALFEQVDLDIWPDKVKGLYFHCLQFTSNDDNYVIAFGEQLLKQRIKEVHIYKGLILRGIKMKRKLVIIDGLVFSAIKDFPEEKEEFEKLLANYKME